MDNEKEIEESLNTEEEETSKNDDDKDYQALYENQKIRAEKAEKKLKDVPEPKKEEKDEVTSKKDSSLSVKDSARLQQANVPVDDWDDVIDYANYKSISIAEAMKSSVVKATLAGKAEELKTANATETGKGKRGSSKVSGANSLEKFKSNGKVPEGDAELDAMLEAKYAA